MNHYCCIVDTVEPEGTGTRVLMVVANSGTREPVTHQRMLVSSPPIVGKVTSLAKSFENHGDTYAQAFTIAMAQEVESAMRRGSFPNLNLEIPDIFVDNLMQTYLPNYIGHHFLGLIVYTFSV